MRRHIIFERSAQLHRTLFSRHRTKQHSKADKNRPIKIAFVSDAVYPYNKGGKEKRLYEISTRLAKRGYEVTIYCMKWWKGFDETLRDGVRLKAICPLYRLYSGERRSIRQAKIFGLSTLKLLFEDFDVVDVDQMPFYPLFFMKIVCLLKWKKMYTTWHEVWGRDYWIKYMGLKGVFGYFVEKLSVYMPDTIIAISDVTKTRLRTILGSSKPIVVIPPGVDVGMAHELGTHHTYDILYAGRLLKHKNIDVLLQALAEIVAVKPDVSCMIVGDGPERENLMRQAAIIGIAERVQFRKFLELDGDLYDMMRASKIFVLPSNREGFGLVGIEANACGLPVVTSDARENAFRTQVQNGYNGLISKIEPKPLAQNILTALTHASEWRLNCITASRKYDWNRVVEILGGIYG